MLGNFLAPTSGALTGALLGSKQDTVAPFSACSDLVYTRCPEVFEGQCWDPPCLLPGPKEEEEWASVSL